MRWFLLHDIPHLYRDPPVGKFEVDIKKLDLLNDIEQPKQQLGSTSNASAPAFREAITKAQEVYGNASATLENVMQACAHLAQAAETIGLLQKAKDNIISPVTSLLVPEA
jgi:hypothetical protein